MMRCKVMLDWRCQDKKLSSQKEMSRYWCCNEVWSSSHNSWRIWKKVFLLRSCLFGSTDFNYWHLTIVLWPIYALRLMIFRIWLYSVWEMKSQLTQQDALAEQYRMIMFCGRNYYCCIILAGTHNGSVSEHSSELQAPMRELPRDDPFHTLEHEET